MPNNRHTVHAIRGGLFTPLLNKFSILMCIGVPCKPITDFFEMSESIICGTRIAWMDVRYVSVFDRERESARVTSTFLGVNAVRTKVKSIWKEKRRVYARTRTNAQCTEAVVPRYA